MSLPVTGLVAVAVLVALHLAGRVLRKRFRFPAPACIGRVLDSRLRKWAQSPETVIDRSGIGRGMRVLEVGCGSGAFTTSAAEALGGQGAVYALDVQQRMLKQLRRKLAHPCNRELTNIAPVLSEATTLPFRDSCFDVVFMVGVLQEIPARESALGETYRVLRPGGMLAVTEFLPDPDYPLKSTTVRVCSESGFLPDAVHGSFWNYTARFTRP